MQFAGSHILSISQFERADVEQLFTVADAMRPYAHRERRTRVLDGAILGSMFLNPPRDPDQLWQCVQLTWWAKSGKRPGLSTRPLPRANHSMIPRVY